VLEFARSNSVMAAPAGIRREFGSRSLLASSICRCMIDFARDAASVIRGSVAQEDLSVGFSTSRCRSTLSDSEGFNSEALYYRPYNALIC
jgi:hypothetical protein